MGKRRFSPFCGRSTLVSCTKSSHRGGLHLCLAAVTRFLAAGSRTRTMLSSLQAYLPGSMRTLSLSLNLGSVLLLGTCAGKAAAGMSDRRRRHASTAAGAAAADAAPGREQPVSSAAASHAASAEAAADSPLMAVRVRRPAPSRWMRGQPLFAGAGAGGAAARSYASMPCPISDDEEDDYEFDQEDLTDLRWQYLWQEQQEALLAGQRSTAASAAVPRTGGSSNSSNSSNQAYAAGATATADGASGGLQSQQQQQQQVVAHVPQALVQAAQAGPGGTAALPWERLGAEEQARRLAAYRAEGLPYSKRSMHSMVLPFLLEAYSMASPPPEEAAVAVKPRSKAGRPRKVEAAEGERGDAGRQQQREWAGGAPSAGIYAAVRRLFPSGSGAALGDALGQLDACFTRAGAWNPNYGPEQLLDDAHWRTPGRTRAAHVIGFLLEEAGATHEDVLAAIRSAPWILGLDVDAQARPALELLLHNGFSREHQGAGGQQRGSSQAGRLLASRPALMLMPQEQLEPLLQYIGALLPGTAQAERLLGVNPSLLAGPRGLERLRLVVSFLAGKGLGKEEVVRVVTQVPRVLQYSPQALQVKWQFMEQVLGGGGKDIAACPYYLEASIPNVLGPRVALAQELGMPVLLPSDVEGEGQKRGGIKRAARAAGAGEHQSGISLWKLLRDSTSTLAQKLGTSAEEVQQHVRRWQQTEAARWQAPQPRQLEYYMQLGQSCVSAVEEHLATHQRCCSY